MMLIARALKFVSFDKIEDHFRLGWMVMIPNMPSHHNHYGVEMKWICPCEVPGGFSQQEENGNDECSLESSRYAAAE